MNRREFLQTAAAGITAAGAWRHYAFGRGEVVRKPNVIVVFIDDLAYGELGSFGCPDIPTPHMDSLAVKGVKCTNSYVTNPPCCPSRCCLMAGMYPQRFGKYGMARGQPIPADHPTMAEFMRDAGYVTGMVGKWDIGSREQGPLDRGFDEVARVPPKKPGKRYQCLTRDGADAYLTDLDGDYIADFATRHKDEPFFLYFSPFAIHEPNAESPQHYRDRSTATGKRKALAGALIALDDAVGKLLAALRKHGLENDTLILLTGDNGGSVKSNCRATPYRGGKLPGNTIYEGWVHTPAIVSWPGHLPEGKTYEGLMCTMDFYATAAAVAGKPLPKRCEGVNLLPYLRGQTPGDAHEELYWRNMDPTDPPHRHLQAMRWKQWRLIKIAGRWRLFDLKADPREEKDLAEAHPDVVASMQKRYDAWAATLPPVIEGGRAGKPGGRMPRGWGWATDKNKEQWPQATPKKRKARGARGGTTGT